ncbi:MAG: Cof-type HAD-IIB family hydrolase [Schleiferilactobacillus harbinensis]|jgi:Cof subfamily protein (haloacid dehalogenase superfamily)|nr:Cof-type HAD-IIB family hydrolase [Schleiferilactobacillus harbinensis]MCI1913456.1 Cof-type HAD-IIB family hydrolase [Schleiferilactobacillus harbinensis]
MTIKMIALDIDDTLLDSKGKILPSTITAIHEALARDIKIVLCTGRPLAGVAHFLKELGVTGDDQYVVTYNGAVIESVSGHVLVKHLLNKATYERLTQYAAEHHIPFNVLDENSTIYTADRDIDFITVVQAMENSAGIFVRTPAEMPADFEIAKGLFVGTEEQLDAVESTVMAEFSDAYYVVRAGRNFLEVMDSKVDKGKALAELAQKLGMTADEVMAVGDEGNDLPMFEFAGTAVVMGNGSEVAKAHADYVTGTNDEGGLADAIRKFALTPVEN